MNRFLLKNDLIYLFQVASKLGRSTLLSALQKHFATVSRAIGFNRWWAE